MIEMKLYLKLLGFLQALQQEQSLTLSERGCLAMATQWLSSQETADQELYLNRLERVAARKNVCDFYYLILDMAYRDYQQRVKPTDSQQEALIEKVYQIKARSARNHCLKDFILTGQYLYYPDFFRQYDALTHA